MNNFNKTEAAVFSCRLCFLRAFPFISLMKTFFIFSGNYCAVESSTLKKHMKTHEEHKPLR